MQKDLKLWHGYTYCDKNPMLRPNVVMDFTRTPFRDCQFEEVLFDPPHHADINPARWVKAWYTAYKRKSELIKSVYGGLHEAERILQVGGVCIFKWSTKVLKMPEVMQLRPSNLVIQKVRKVRFRKRKAFSTWFVWLVKVKSDSDLRPVKAEVYIRPRIKPRTEVSDMSKKRVSKKAKSNPVHMLVYVRVAKEILSRIDRERGKSSRGAYVEKYLPKWMQVSE